MNPPLYEIETTWRHEDITMAPSDRQTGDHHLGILCRIPLQTRWDDDMSQLGWWHSQLNGEINFMIQTTNQFLFLWFKAWLRHQCAITKMGSGIRLSKEKLAVYIDLMRNQRPRGLNFLIRMLSSTFSLQSANQCHWENYGHIHQQPSWAMGL